MPCYMTGTAAGDARMEAEEQREKARLVTEMLCRLLGDMEREDIGQEVVNRDPRLTSWWDHHKEFDYRRRLQEKARVEKIEARKKALAKLTSAERAALDIQEK